MPKLKRLIWDIETAPNIGLFWGCGWKVNIPHENVIQERAIICICWKWEGQKSVRSLQWDNGCDKEMLKQFAEIINVADEMVAHNGDWFDMRWFNARCLIHGLPIPPKAKTVDTLKIAKRHFYLNSNRLDYLAKILLPGVKDLGEGKTKTDYSMWKDILLRNNKKAMRQMVAYCMKDVEILEAVWKKLKNYEVPATHAAVLESGNARDRWMCPHCGSSEVYKSKARVSAKGMVQHQMKCWGCASYYTIANAVFGYYQEAKRAERLAAKE